MCDDYRAGGDASGGDECRPYGVPFVLIVSFLSCYCCLLLVCCCVLVSVVMAGVRGDRWQRVCGDV